VATEHKQHRTTVAVLLVAAASGIAAAYAEGAPTGNSVADAVWRIAFAVAVTWCGAHAARWTWIITTGVAAAAAVGAEPLVVIAGVASLALALIGGIRRDRSALIGALAIALAVQALLRLPSFGFSGASALVAGLAVVPVFYSAWRRSTRRVRRRSVWALAIAAGVVVVALVPAVLSAVVTARESDVATRESDAGLDAAREGDQAGAIEHLERSQAAFTEIEDATSGALLWPARVLPVVGPQLATVNQIAASGQDVTASAAAAARVATPENLELINGQIDVELLRALSEPVDGTTRALQEAQTDLAALNRTWLLPPLESKVDEYEEQVDEAVSDSELASQALAVAPGLLGAEGPRTYLVLFGSPAETRELGGFIGNAAILTADQGTITLERVLRTRELNQETFDLPPERLDEIAVSGFPSRYLDYEPWRNWQNVTGTPDFPTVSNMVRELAPDAIGRPVDGVLYVDPEGLAGLLRLTGPIEVEGLEQPLGPDNVADFLLREQYVLYPETPDRIDFLESVAETTFELLTSSDLPGPRAFGEALGGAVDEGHIRFWTFDPEEQALFTRLGTSGAFGRTAADDELLVTVANANPNKIDAYLHREVGYRAELDPESGRVSAAVTVTLENSAPLDLSDYVIGNANDEPQGTNRTFLSLYTGLGVEGATVDGRPVAFEAQVEYGLRRAGVFVSVPPGGRSEIVFQLQGSAPAASARGTYTLRVQVPALVFPDRITAALALTGEGQGDGPRPAGTPELSGLVVADPPPMLEPGSAAYEAAGVSIVRFPVGG
jgi:hypothetical protein